MKAALETCFPGVKAGVNKSSLAIATKFNIRRMLNVAYTFLQGVLGGVLNGEA